MNQLADLPASVGVSGKQLSGLASSSHFTLTVAGQAADTFKVIHWQGEEGISRSYRYTLSLAAHEEVDAGKLLGQDATLGIDWDGETRKIHGYVSELTHIGTLVSDHAEEYQLVLESPLSKLKQNRQSRVFLNLDMKSLLEKILLDAGFDATTFKIELSGNYPVREYTVQYNESDYNFLTRQLEHNGLFYTYTQEKEHARLEIRDDSTTLPKMQGCEALEYKATTGQVENVESIQALQKGQYYLTQSVKRKDHNYRTPDTPLVSEAATGSGIPATGTDYIYGERAPTLEESDQLAQRRLQAIDWQRAIYVAETNCRGISSGVSISIHGHPIADNNGDYLVVSATHEGNQSNAFAFGGASTNAATDKTYRNELTLIKKEIPYRPPVDDERRTVVPGVLSAKVESTGGDYAYLDDQGRYRVRSPFDLSETQGGEASHPVRMAQPNAGPNHGVHFPLLAGTEVLLACMNGDPDRPVILGSIANPASQSPVTSLNASQHIVRTAAGNEIMMEDQQGNEKINLHTKDQKNVLSLDANSDGHLIALRTEEGKAEFYAKKTMDFESTDSCTLKAGNDQTITVENKHSVQTNKKEIEFKAGTDILLTAKEALKLNAVNKDITLNSGQDMIVEAGKSLSLKALSGNGSLVVEQGALSMEAAMEVTITGQGGGAITISQGGGTIQISTSGDLIINASSVEISGSSVNISGQQVSVG